MLRILKICLGLFLVLMVFAAVINIGQGKEPVGSIIIGALAGYGAYRCLFKGKKSKGTPKKLTLADIMPHDEDEEFHFSKQELAAFEKELAKQREPEYYACLKNGGDLEFFKSSCETFRRDSKIAKSIGAKTYVWRTAKDGGVCPRCKGNNAKVFSYAKEPPGGHPGMAPGCRCYAEAIIPKEFS